MSLFLLILWFSFVNCVLGTPLLALTGTAGVDTEKAMVTDLVMIMGHGKQTPKAIIFCDTLYLIASVWNHLSDALRRKCFSPKRIREA